MARTILQTQFGSAVRICRDLLGISQEELAWRAGLHRTYITDIERGVRNVTLKSVANLARALEVSMESLIAMASKATPDESVLEKEPPRKFVGEVLMIEDSAEDAELTLHEFRQARFSNPMRIISDGAEALDYLFARGLHATRDRTTNPEVVLLDLNLPSVPGIEVLRQIRADVHTKKIPVVVLTGSREDQDVQQCRELGVEAYIVKPVDFENFRQATSQLSFDWALLKPTSGTKPGRKKAA